MAKGLFTLEGHELLPAIHFGNSYFFFHLLLIFLNLPVVPQEEIPHLVPSFFEGMLNVYFEP